ncbi:MAG TPA: DNA-binding protein [Aquifex aeolicus]|nr:DNA-binding protein [Aquifex aeolicus]
MTKRDITNKLYDRLVKENGLKLNKKELYDIVSEIFNIIEEKILEGENIKVSGFGTFIVKNRKPKKGMNLKEMKLIEIPERKVVVFKPSRQFIKL